MKIFFINCVQLLIVLLLSVGIHCLKARQTLNPSDREVFKEILRKPVNEPGTFGAKLFGPLATDYQILKVCRDFLKAFYQNVDRPSPLIFPEYRRQIKQFTKSEHLKKAGVSDVDLDVLKDEHSTRIELKKSASHIHTIEYRILENVYKLDQMASGKRIPTDFVTEYYDDSEENFNEM